MPFETEEMQARQKQLEEMLNTMLEQKVKDFLDNDKLIAMRNELNGLMQSEFR